MAIISNCYGCAKREVGCHSNCESYRKYREQLDVINNRKRYIKWQEQLRRCYYGKTKSR